jgi:hypothetical protein
VEQGQPWTFTVKPVASYQADFFRYRWRPEEIVPRLTIPQDLPGLPSRNGSAGEGALEVLLSPKKGHLAQMLAAGLMGTLELPGEVIKGRSVKRTVVTDESDADTERTVHTTKWDAHIIRVTPQGVEAYAGQQALPFLEQHAVRLAALLEDKIRPFGYATTDEEQLYLDTLSPRPRPGGGQGLYENQRETVVAALRALERYQVAHIIAEMGYGKTTVASSVVDTADRYPALILCPPHLVEKWAREFVAVVPDAQPVVVGHVADLIDVIAGHREGQKLVVITAWTTLSQGPGWEPALAYRHVLPVSDHPEVQKSQRAGFRQALAAYRAAQARLRAATAAGASAEVVEALREETAEFRTQALRTTRRYPVCPRCGQGIDKVGRSRSTLRCTCEDDYLRVASFRGGVAEEGGEDEEEEAYQEPQECYGALFHYREKVSRRWPLADYIAGRARTFFKLLVADECHQYKGASDRGEAYGRLCDVIGPVLNLTGTFYGGVASSIFYLLYRSQPELRHAWGYGDEQRWIATFGRIQKTYSTSITTGSHNARKRVNVNTKEIPGIAPTVLKHLLKTAVFRSVADLGIGLPAYRDEVVTLDMAPRQSADYQRVADFTWEEVRQHKQRYLSSWLQWTLARPNSAFRKEVVAGLSASGKRGPQGAPLPVTLTAHAVPAAGELLPKEAWLVHKCRNEIAEGRRVILYLRQTGTRDIRMRLVQILQEAGLNAENLPDSLAPSKREAWLEKHHPDILITNPKRVETGLDLVMYHTAIFYEIEYSLYTVWQACRRIWRPGQTRPVKVYYVVYRDTMEEQAIRLIGKKMAAGQMLYGDDVAGALVDDEDDFMKELLRAIMDDEELAAVESLFGQDEGTTESPVGSPTRTSLPLKNPIVAWMLENDIQRAADVVSYRPRRSNHVKAPELQLSLAL